MLSGLVMVTTEIQAETRADSRLLSAEKPTDWIIMRKRQPSRFEGAVAVLEQLLDGRALLLAVIKLGFGLRDLGSDVAVLHAHELGFGHGCPGAQELLPSVGSAFPPGLFRALQDLDDVTGVELQLVLLFSVETVQSSDLHIGGGCVLGQERTDRMRHKEMHNLHEPLSVSSFTALRDQRKGERGSREKESKREMDTLYNGSCLRRAPRPVAFLELQDDEATFSAIAAESGAINLGYTAREQALGGGIAHQHLGGCLTFLVLFAVAGDKLRNSPSLEGHAAQREWGCWTATFSPSALPEIHQRTSFRRTLQGHGGINGKWIGGEERGLTLLPVFFDSFPDILRCNATDLPSRAARNLSSLGRSYYLTEFCAKLKMFKRKAFSRSALNTGMLLVGYWLWV
ncbi:hypothetical protein FQN60_012480 [Etheostoma spectabile]|uniref:Uncharacterized protein n=1 Tax=Etheostoma spectabile TaxID=54343 RepID=A0A5J5DPR8_9PERO|nr:hypothetical protein FQN60_012480 [Etheostoma spectabile]